MKSLLSILVVLVGMVAIPIQIECIVTNNRPFLFLVLFLLTAPGFVYGFGHIIHLIKKVYEGNRG